MTSIAEKLENYSIPITECGCWVWLGTIKDKNRRYGRIMINRKYYHAHRLAWKVWRGEIPSGLSVLHTCDVMECINPDHLYLGTQKDNIRDAIARNRGKQWTREETLKMQKDNKGLFIRKAPGASPH